MYFSQIKDIRKYWFFHIFILFVILSYVILLTFGFYLVFLSPEFKEPSTTEVKIHLWVVSEHPLYPINFSDISIIPSNLTLLTHLNNTLGPSNWEGKQFASNQWLITRIFNATEGTGWVWLYYYQLPSQSSWILAPVGVSAFHLNQNYTIQFRYTNNSLMPIRSTL